MSAAEDLGLTLTRGDEHWVGSFSAMASPCEILTDVDDPAEAHRLTTLVASEARRVEQKYSRYRASGVVHAINAGNTAIEVDEETARLLDYSQQMFQLSAGKFDITSGVLRQVWRFDGSDAVPSREEVSRVRAGVGWSRVAWDGRTIELPAGMEIDLGGVCKEYAVDRAAALVRAASPLSCLVNFGGDLAISRERRRGATWRVGIEDPDQHGVQRLIRLARGALATSGDARRFLIKSGVRYSHILDATTGWPVEGAPRAVTVAAPTCTEAGMTATLAMFKGADAESFLAAEGIPHWTVR